MKALVVDDHPFIRTAITLQLEKEGLEVVGAAGDGIEAVHLAKTLQPDLMVLDIALPMLDGLEVINRISILGLPTRILVLTSLNAEFYSARCMKAGAAGYLGKTGDEVDLSRAVKAIMSGYTFFPNLTMSTVRRDDSGASDLSLIQKLSDRELSILQQLSRGMSNKEIGEAMLISSKTVSTYKARLIEKLRVKSLVYLADFARRNHLI
ncbi:response regulator transcription factor [Pseudomonas costantinii]|uniref:DNA-binding response regulator n=1 Tax=Pseudomonas costantinii TaxID=168469 RepID=A0A1S2V350_9PSED|nr:response regulator transcription factor [Pseudomonas costantinii]OIN53164.1 DNA-binding response regulator [Pseudomonas costantinii]SED21010.1 two component transcriptional regulator, LuxR family [Pseudomonas costantinii]